MTIAARTSSVVAPATASEAVSRLGPLVARQQELIDAFNAAIPLDAEGRPPFDEAVFEDMHTALRDAHTALVTALGYCSSVVWQETQQQRQQYRPGGVVTGW